MSKKSRRLARSGVAAPAPAPVAAAPADPWAALSDREWSFWFLPDAESHVVDERALHGLMKDWRHGRATRTLSQVFGDAYFAIFSVVLVGAMVVNLVVTAQASAQGCDTAACASGRTLLPWALWLTVASVSFAVARLFGPVMASAAEGFWLMEAPLRRSRLLRGRFWLVVAGAIGLGAVLASLVAALAGAPGDQVLAWALATGSTSGAVMAFAALEQAHERAWPGRILQAVAGASAAGTLVLMVAVSAGWVALALPPGVEAVPWVVAAVAGVATLGLAAWASGLLDGIRRARLLSGGSFVSGMQGAMFALDLGLARDILVERDAVARGHVRPTRGRGVGLTALVWRDAQRLVRFPRQLVGVGAAILVPYAVDALGLGAMTPFIAGLALVFALVPLLGNLRVLTRTGGLARTLPFSTAQIRTATMVVPAVLATLWAVAIWPASLGLTGGSHREPLEAVGVSVATALAGLLGAVRWQTARPVDFGTPMVATSAGAMPPTLVLNLFRGFDVVALVTAPLLLGASPLWSLGLGAIVLMVLRNGKSMTELQADAEEQREQLDALKAENRAEKGPEKIRLSRPSR